MAKLSHAPEHRGATIFTSELSGEGFYPEYGTFWGRVTSDAIWFYVSSWTAFNLWLDDLPILEHVAPTGYVSLIGTATAQVEESHDAAISVAFDGSFAYCGREKPATPPYPPSCAVSLVECRSAHHHLDLTRR